MDIAPDAGCICRRQPTLHEEEGCLCKSCLCPGGPISSTGVCQRQGLLKAACSQELSGLSIESNRLEQPHLQGEAQS